MSSENFIGDLVRSSTEILEKVSARKAVEKIWEVTGEHKAAKKLWELGGEEERST